MKRIRKGPPGACETALNRALPNPQDLSDVLQLEAKVVPKDGRLALPSRQGAERPVHVNGFLQGPFGVPKRPETFLSPRFRSEPAVPAPGQVQRHRRDPRDKRLDPLPSQRPFPGPRQRLLNAVLCYVAISGNQAQSPNKLAVFARQEGADCRLLQFILLPPNRRSSRSLGLPRCVTNANDP